MTSSNPRRKIVNAYQSLEPTPSNRFVNVCQLLRPTPSNRIVNVCQLMEPAPSNPIVNLSQLLRPIPSNRIVNVCQLLGFQPTPPVERSRIFRNSSSSTSTGTGGFSRRGSTSSMLKKPPPPLERKLSCSLEELYTGSTRKMKISRTVVQPDGRLVQEPEIISVHVEPGWKNGTKVTFSNKGNEQLNQLPTDLVFVIIEKPHVKYTRDGNDLIMNHKLSLADASAGTTLNFKTLDGRNLLVSVTDTVTPGYELVVAGEGMPISMNPGTKGNLKIKFDVNEFPTRLTPGRKSTVRRGLKG